LASNRQHHTTPTRRSSDLAYTMPHANNELGNKTGNGMETPDFGPYASESWPDQEKGFAAMITRMDKDVGKLMANLKSLGLDENRSEEHTSELQSPDHLVCR